MQFHKRRVSEAAAFRNFQVGLQVPRNYATPLNDPIRWVDEFEGFLYDEGTSEQDGKHINKLHYCSSGEIREFL